MLTEFEAREQVLNHITPGVVETVPLISSLGRYSATQVLASEPLPGFDNSQVDGYAVRSSEAFTHARLPLMPGEQPAGRDRGLTLEPQHAVRIFTGGVIPAGADAVVMQEDVSVVDGSIVINEGVVHGENIRATGSDLCRGQVLLRPGQPITAGIVGLLASQGASTVAVRTLPRIAVLSTGDELIEPGQPLQPGQLYNSNGPMLAAMLASQGFPGATTHHCPDYLEATFLKLTALSEKADVIIVSGGVSVGDHDHVKPALAALGLPPQFWQVKVKPGKPFLFTQRQEPRPLYVFGLPGNPVSSFVTFQLFVRPALLKLVGSANTALPTLEAELTEPVQNKGGRPHYLRGQLRQGRFSPMGTQASHALFGLSQSNALLRLEADASLAANAKVTVHPFT